jgi:16S rRNA (adenine1518-N6/adenine1519-N6)-dimethyltransferase
MLSPKTLLSIHRIMAKKQLGQNFLAEPGTAESIVSRSGISGEHIVVEIGSGLGALTIPIARRAKRVYAVELDGRIIPVLEDLIRTAALTNIVILKQSALDIDFQKISSAEGNRLTVAGNLPYHISSQVLIRLIQFRRCIRQAVLMFQKELAHRLMGEVGTRDYGRITVMLKYAAEIEPLIQVNRSKFFPRPNVDSQVVRISFKDSPCLAPQMEKLLFEVIRAAFSKRRKTLKNALTASSLHVSPDQVANALLESHIDGRRRAETLNVEEFVSLTESLALHDLGD